MSYQPRPQIPTYLAAAEVLEKKTGSGIRMAGWTVLRTLMIAPPMMLVGVPAKQAWAGATLASGLITVFAILRLFNAGQNGVGLAGARGKPSMRQLRSRCR